MALVDSYAEVRLIMKNLPAILSQVHLVDWNYGNCLRYPRIPYYPITIWVKFTWKADIQSSKWLVHFFCTP